MYRTQARLYELYKISLKSQHRDRTHARTDTQRQTHQAHETADTPTTDRHAHLRKPPQTETHTPTATPNHNPPLTPSRRLTPVALSRGHDALLRELHHQRRQLLAARRPRALPLRVARDGRQLLPRQPNQLGLAVAVPRKLAHDDDAQAAAVGGDDEAVAYHRLLTDGGS